MIRPHRFVALAAALVATVPLAAQQPAFTLEQALSAPFPDDLVAAPTGGAVAWVFNANGARNIWVAAPPEYQGRPVTAYADDDGQEIGDLVWTPDGKAIAFTRGGSANGRGEIPNPRSVTSGVKQEVWLVTVPGGTVRRLGEGNSPTISPKGDHVAFIQRGQVWWASLADSSPAEQLIHARGSASALRWSPDGGKLAFVSNRGDHAFIAVYDMAGKTLRFLDPALERDDDPVWSLDGARIAFTRAPPEPGRVPFTPRREAQPWSIRVAEVATGAGREIWKADPGAGSAFHDVVADQQLLWLAGDRIVFPWEKDGWTHLYAVPVTGGRATLLTPGEFEVEYVAASADRTTLYFNSNQGDIDRRHVWRVAAAGGAPAAVSGGAGIEWAPVATADGKAVAFLRSDGRKPPRPAVLVGAGPARDLAAQAMPADFPEAALVEPQQVVFSAADGIPIHGQLFLPKGLRPGGGERRPAVIFFHGGSRRQMLLGWHYMYYYRNAYALNQYLASRGYVVLSVNYRSGIGYGLNFREALHYGAQGASEFNDVMGAGVYLRTRADVDPAKIGLWGGSYGGYLTALGLARASDLFAAGVDLHGVHDWNTEIQNWVSEYDPAKQADVARVAFESSPIAALNDWRSPVLLIHGDDDRNVQFSQSVELGAALRARGVQVEQLVFPDEIHDFLLHADWLRAYHAAADFFQRKLGR
ncbi:MAG: S9 family peptidase [Gemmatimonadetes bacterium]|nr:MAG: S9 family peptidase [Gemmatimonadota bacterium]